MKQCLFCGDPAGSREHIFAQWLIDRMDARGQPFVVAHRTMEKIESRAPHGLQAFTTRHVCRPCNNGWMSTLEGNFQRHLGCLIEKKWSKLATTNLFAAATEGEMIGRWALKVIACIGKAGIKSNVVKSHMAHALKDGKLPSDFHVRLGHLSTPGIGTVITKGLPVRNGGRPVQWQEHKDGEAFKAVIALNHLAVGIVRAPSAHLTYVAWENSLPVVAYPTAEKREREGYSFTGIESFDKAIEVETWLGCPSK